jgi:FMN phosphatase YigB (HAD superfamily)
MANKISTVVFCDIGDILGSPVLSPPPPPRRLERLDLFPFVFAVLKQLKDNKNRLGIISNTGDEKPANINKVLKAAGILDFFEPDLLIYSSEVHLKKDSPEIFKLAAEKAGLASNPEKCLFVGEDPRERSFAAQAGFRVARELSLLSGDFPVALTMQPDISNMDNCIADVRLAA